MKIFDTIAAISTPRGKGGVAMIRISGGRALEYASAVFSPKNGVLLSDIESRHAVYGDIRERDAAGNETVIDDGIATVYRAPNSFTGEDTVEICCHGGVLVTESVLSACLAAGCRQAEAGEFTRRAFISGRMSLSQAEDLGALLEAKTHSQMLLSRSGLDGYLTRDIRGVYEDLREILSSVYAKIDFPDEDLSSLNESEMRIRVERAEEKLAALERTYKAGHAVREGVKTVICGRTNAGKSSLYNSILGRDAAIVTSIEGTTRDVLEQTASLGKVTLLLCDTAGLRDTEDEVESIGIERTRRAIEDAELIFAVFDVSRDLSDEDRFLLDDISSLPGAVVAILNKCDIEENAVTVKEISERIDRCVKISAKMGDGMEQLRETVEDLFDCGEIDLRTDSIVTSARQRASILRAIESLGSARAALLAGVTVDICGTDIECAMSALAEIDGREVTEDIVSEIFSHFCVGK
ncbi:MAG: tRNA uridine-5-carboxymethylaminomethyl(34) synthesis GTPase MnmE [Ruminococcaceae bacterium]|nr:tRNA uridine-5-carboxymethylaminomethyl(34) synthesis GTPase MnmE [Oscillospiraceae bacterium]